MPSPIDTWRAAMASVDLSNPARPQKEIWGYWIPEPGLLLRPQTSDRLHRYVFNWLRMRHAWLYVLRLREARVTEIPTQWWRDFLYGDTGRATGSSTTFNAKRIAQMQEVFGLAFEEANYDPDNSSPLQWFNHRLSKLDVSLCPMVIWEVCELGFRHELLALDRLLVPMRDRPHAEAERDELLSHVFPRRCLYNVPEIPINGVGLCAALPRHRVPYLQAFRHVMARWPKCPSSFYKAEHDITINMSDAMILVHERALVDFYVATFFEQSGRAPIVPTQLPL